MLQLIRLGEGQKDPDSAFGLRRSRRAVPDDEADLTLAEIRDGAGVIRPVAVADGDSVAGFKPQDLGMGGIFPGEGQKSGLQLGNGHEKFRHSSLLLFRLKFAGHCR